MSIPELIKILVFKFQCPHLEAHLFLLFPRNSLLGAWRKGQTPSRWAEHTFFSQRVSHDSQPVSSPETAREVRHMSGKPCCPIPCPQHLLEPQEEDLQPQPRQQQQDDHGGEGKAKPGGKVHHVAIFREEAGGGGERAAVRHCPEPPSPIYLQSELISHSRVNLAL